MTTSVEHPPSQPTGGSTVSGGVHYKVTPEYLSSARSDTYNTADTISGQLTELKSYVTSLEETWGGVAHATFNTLMQEWNVYASMLHDALVDIGKGLDGTYVNYVGSEEQNIKTLQGLGADLTAPSGGTNFD
ncbi:WXG100 family type VII secretion target [Streptomyces sp. NPDC051639]|uniref:WXG100 family type VII secretion target n=1 Tax=Streptomyces sp. NPDC051639 TaxID=3155671 RepID=UPI0034262786